MPLTQSDLEARLMHVQNRFNALKTERDTLVREVLQPSDKEFHRLGLMIQSLKTRIQEVTPVKR